MLTAQQIEAMRDNIKASEDFPVTMTQPASDYGTRIIGTTAKETLVEIFDLAAMAARIRER